MNPISFSPAAGLRAVFTLDLRSLALFRIVLGLVLLFDTLGRLTDIGALYSDHGVLPRSLLSQLADPWALSLHAAGGAASWTLWLLLAQIVASLALLAGWQARKAAAVGWLLSLSLDQRNPLAAGDGEALLHLLLLWAAFLPISARAGLDAVLSRNPAPQDQAHRSWASAGLLLAILSFFFFGTLLRSGDAWWPQGTALAEVFAAQGRAPFGASALHALTLWVWTMGWLGPLLALLPLWTRALRALAVMQFIALSLLLIFTLDLGLLPWALLAASFALIDRAAWDVLTLWRERHTPPGRLRLYYDRDCAFCLAFCRSLRLGLLLFRAEIHAAQDQPRAASLMRANGSWVVLDYDDKAYLRGAAMILLLRRSTLFGWLGRLLSREATTAWADRVYDRLAARRGTLSRLLLPVLREREVRFTAGPRAMRLTAVLLFLSLIWQLSTVGLYPRLLLRPLQPALTALGLDARWDRWAPAPAQQRGHFVAAATLDDGREVDLLTGRAPDFSGARSARHTDERWQRYLAYLAEPGSDAARAEWGRYLCRDWNARRDSEAQSLRLIYLAQAGAGSEQQVMLRQDCAALAD